MRFFCDVLPNVPAMSGAPVISNVSMIFPDIPEPEALEHWVLGGTAASFAGRKGISTMLPVGAAPTFHGNYVETATGILNGLSTGIVDADKQAFALVMKFTDGVTNGGRVILGSATQSGGTGARTDGFILTQSSGNAANPNQIQGQYRAGANASPFPAASIPGLIDKWIFIGMATDIQTKIQSFYIHGLGYSPRAADTATWNKANVPVGIGNAYYNTPSGQTTKYDQGIAVAEAMAFNKVPTAAEWAEIAARSVARQSLRGIEIYKGS